MIIETGKKYLVTTDNWFFAPDGHSYKSVWGTAVAIQSDEEVLGIKTNRGSTNWYLLIGKMLIAGCQIHYAIQCDECTSPAFTREDEPEGKLHMKETTCRTYVTD